MKLLGIKAVLFDLDGTLLDTAGDIGAAINRALESYGLPAFPPENVPKVIGGGIRSAIGKTLPEGKEGVLDEVVGRYLRDYPEHCCEKTRAYPGMEETVEYLRGNGYRLGIISNKTEATVRKIADYFFPRGTFELVWGNNGTRPLKPAPDAGRAACRVLGLEPEQIFFLGDGETDVVFARQMGFVSAGACWGYRGRACLEENGARLLLDSLEELRELL